MHIESNICSLLINCCSSGIYWVKPNEPLDLGIIVIFTTGEQCFKNHPTIAWPASWCATVSLSTLVSFLFVSSPANTLSEAFSKQVTSTSSFSSLAAKIAASLTRLAI